MKNFIKLSKIFFLMELRNKQAIFMSTLFPILMMALMGTAGQDAARGEMSYMTFIFPGILGMAYGAVGVIAVPVMISSYRERGIIKKVKIAPISNLKFIVSVFATQIFVMLIQTIIILIISIGIFNVKLSNNMSDIILLSLLLLAGNIAILGIGFIIGNFSSSSKNATTMGNLTNLVMIFMGGTFFETDVWPKILMPLIKINPLSYMIEAIRKTLIYETQTIKNYFGELIPILLIMIISLFIAAKTFKYE